MTPASDTVSDERLARLISNARGSIRGPHITTKEIRLVLTELQRWRATLPADRAAVIEECAKMCEGIEEMLSLNIAQRSGPQAASDCAKAIRSLSHKDKDNG